MQYKTKIVPIVKFLLRKESVVVVAEISYDMETGELSGSRAKLVPEKSIIALKVRDRSVFPELKIVNSSNGNRYVSMINGTLSPEVNVAMEIGAGARCVFITPVHKVNNSIWCIFTDLSETKKTKELKVSCSARSMSNDEFFSAANVSIKEIRPLRIDKYEHIIYTGPIAKGPNNVYISYIPDFVKSSASSEKKSSGSMVDKITKIMESIKSEGFTDADDFDTKEAEILKQYKLENTKLIASEHFKSAARTQIKGTVNVHSFVHTIEKLKVLTGEDYRTVFCEDKRINDVMVLTAMAAVANSYDGNATEYMKNLLHNEVIARELNCLDIYTWLTVYRAYNKMVVCSKTYPSNGVYRFMDDERGGVNIIAIIDIPSETLIWAGNCVICNCNGTFCESVAKGESKILAKDMTESDGGSYEISEIYSNGIKKNVIIEHKYTYNGHVLHTSLRPHVFSPIVPLWGTIVLLNNNGASIIKATTAIKKDDDPIEFLLKASDDKLENKYSYKIELQRTLTSKEIIARLKAVASVKLLYKPECILEGDIIRKYIEQAINGKIVANTLRDMTNQLRDTFKLRNKQLTNVDRQNRDMSVYRIIASINTLRLYNILVNKQMLKSIRVGFSFSKVSACKIVTDSTIDKIARVWENMRDAVSVQEVKARSDRIAAIIRDNAIDAGFIKIDSNLGYEGPTETVNILADVLPDLRQLLSAIIHFEANGYQRIKYDGRPIEIKSLAGLQLIKDFVILG